jgi:voltage-gated potassium channel
MNIIDLDGEEGNLDLPPAPPVPSPSPPLPNGHSKAFNVKLTAGPAGYHSTGSAGGGAAAHAERKSHRTVSEVAQLGEELSHRLDKIDNKLDWIISRVKVPSMPDVHASRNSDKSESSRALTEGERTTKLRSIAADGSQPPMFTLPGRARTISLDHRKNTIDTLDSPAMQMLQQMGGRNFQSRGSNALSAVSDGEGSVTRIPNLNRRPGMGSTQGSGRSRSLRGGSVRITQVPAMFKSQFLARRVYEKSKNKDMAYVQKCVQSLPKAMRKKRSKVVDYVYTVLDDPSSSKVAWWTATWLQALVLLSVLGSFLQTVEDPPLHGWLAAIVETMFDVVFLTEVCIRWGCSPNMVNFVFVSQSWVDIVAASALAVRAAVGFVLPESQDDLVSIFLLCFVPIIRLLKIVRHFETFNVLVQAVKITMEALPMLLYAVALITMTFATFIYLVEPELFESPFRAFYFCLVTITTVGYGDYAPSTTAGIAINIILIVLGVILMAVPMGIIGMTFNEVWNTRDYSLLLSKTRAKLRQWGYTAHDIPTLFKIVDYDENGVLELDEFCELVKEMKIGLSEDRVVALFEHMDKDGSGALDAAEFALEVFPETFVEAFGHAEKTDLSHSSNWMSNLAATIGGSRNNKGTPGTHD